MIRAKKVASKQIYVLRKHCVELGYGAEIFALR